MKNQITLNNCARVEGVGLHTGKDVVVEFFPAPAGAGRIIRNNGESYRIGPEKAAGVKRGTTLRFGKSVIHTIEHMLAAITGLGIDNVEIKITGSEAPVMDGSSFGFVKALKKAGLKKQTAKKKYLTPKGPAVIKEKDSFIALIPAEGLKVHYFSDFSAKGINPEHVFFDSSRESFEKKLSKARTFGFREELKWLFRAGLIKGAAYENAVLIDKGKPVKNRLRYTDELTRHKALDVVGDFGLLGPNLNVAIIAVKTGHRHNIRMIKEIMKKSKR